MKSNGQPGFPSERTRNSARSINSKHKNPPRETRRSWTESATITGFVSAPIVKAVRRIRQALRRDR